MKIRITVPADTVSLETVNEFIRELLGEDDGRKERFQIELAVEEIFVNIAHYAYGEKKGEVVVDCCMEDDGTVFSITFSDRGKPYNPLEKQDPDITVGAEERELGGLGIYLAKNMVDDITYCRMDGENRLTLKKKMR